MKKIKFSIFHFVILFIAATSISHATAQLIIEPDAGREPILKYIHDAKNIDLILYGLTDQIFIQALVDAKKAGKTVNVMLEPLPYKQPEENLQALRDLKEVYITLAKPNPKFQLTHQKTFIFDQQKALIMTFNLTKSTFKNQRNFAVLVDDPAIIKEIQQVYNCDVREDKSEVSHPSLIWSPDNSRQKILDLINYAEKEIKIYAQTVSDYQIIGALAKAAKRNVKVEILTEGKNPTQKKWEFLRKSGVNICFNHRYFIHAKVMLIDKKYVVMGSNNLTKPSFDKNRELSIILTDPNILKKIASTFQQDWWC
ncbi:MAG TPA: phospholipase D-like domain-containing protein [Gammaproteobacteria bacterium]|jgi:phosphatidylserine/phosphatidylglycerophosphate/cardiolipin synthase-like enzyme|nr:phospholipase D-like domain-containing protein [Gammaproteobacteria bacterium]